MDNVPIQPAVAPNQGSAVNNTGRARVGGTSKDVMEQEQPYRVKQEDYFAKTIARLKREYSDVLRDSIPAGHMMRANAARIKFISREVRPYRAQKARRIPLHQEVEVKRMTEDLLKQGIIKQQKDNYTSWCSPATFVPKKPTGLRMVTDYTQLNRHIDRPVHPFPTTEDVQRSIHPRPRYLPK